MAKKNHNKMGLRTAFYKKICSFLNLKKIISKSSKVSKRNLNFESKLFFGLLIIQIVLFLVLLNVGLFDFDDINNILAKDAILVAYSGYKNKKVPVLMKANGKINYFL